MEGANKTILDRLCQACKVGTYADLAKIIGVKPQSVSDAKRKGKVPDGWPVKVSQYSGISLDWLVHGDNQMKPEGSIERRGGEGVLTKTGITAITDIYAQLVGSQQHEIELLREKITVLQKENADLKYRLSLFNEGTETKGNTV
jgi:hypothetical protein